MCNRWIKALLASCIAFVAGPVVHAGNGVWTTNGPWGGSSTQIEAHPGNANRLYAVGQGGLFRSNDSGATWSRAEDGLPAGIRWTGRLFVAPANGDVLYLHLLRSEPSPLSLFYRSTDGGTRWSKLTYALPAFTSFRNLAIDAIDPTGSRLAIINSGIGPSAVALSVNAGLTFAPIPAGVGYVTNLGTRGFAWHGTRLYAGIDENTGTGGNAAVLRSNNGGANWFSTGVVPTTFDSLPHVLTAPSSPLTTVRVYAVGQGITLSGATATNDAPTWTARANLRNQPWISPGNTDTLLQIISTFVSGQFETQVQASGDGGVNFVTRTATGQPEFLDVAGAPAYAATATNGVFYTASGSAGLYRTGDNGTTLSAINQGFGSVSVFAMASPVGNPQRIYAAQSDGLGRSHGVFRTGNGGNSWSALDLSEVRAAFVNDLAIDRTDASRIYAVGGSWLNASTANSGIYRSVDGGVNWTVLENGIPPPLSAGSAPLGRIRKVALDPRSCLSPPPSGPCTTGPLRTGYIVADGVNTAGTNALIVYKSTTLHLLTPTWNVANVGLVKPPPSTANPTLRGRAIAIDPSNPQTLYLGTELTFAGPAPPPSGISNGVFKSTNGGDTWTLASTGLPTWGAPNTTPLNVFALAIDPVNPSTIYAAAARNGSDRSAEAGVYKSTNGGASWSSVRDGLVGVSIRALLVDPNNPQTVYAGGTGTLSNPGGVFRTVNGGTTWNSRSVGLPADAVFSLLLDAGNTNPQRVLAGTNAGVWELTQIPDGDRDAASTPIEDGAPNGGDGNNDGIADSLQNIVASVTGPILPLPDEPSAAERPKGRSNYISMGGGATLAAKGGGCEQINDANVFDAIVFPDDFDAQGRAYRYPFGLVALSLPDCPGTTIRFIFHDANFNPQDWTWRNYGPLTPGNDGSFDWYPYASATLINSKTWEVSVKAGALGSWRSDPESILFRGGPAFLSDRLFRDGFEP